MFSHILNRHRRQAQDMAYSNYKEDVARTQAQREALDVLYRYLDGQEKAPAVKDALTCLVVLHGDPVKAPCRSIWRALAIEEEETRLILIDEAIGQITRYLRRLESAASMPSDRNCT
jgi:hypothetical protein